MIRCENKRIENGLAVWDLTKNGKRVGLVRTRRVEEFGKNLMVLLPGGKRHYVQDHLAATSLIAD